MYHASLRRANREGKIFTDSGGTIGGKFAFSED